MTVSNMEKFKFIDSITSDVLFEAYGKSLKSLFENAAEAMFSVMCKIDKVEPKSEQKVSIKADSLEDLMVNWLQALIAQVDIEGMFYSKFRIIEIDEKHLIGFIYGEPVSQEKGSTVVKAVTYYKFKVKKVKDGYMCVVSLDI